MDATTHRSFILDRVLEYDSLQAVRWAEQCYGLAGIREYYLARGQRVLSANTRSFWRVVLELPEEPSTPPRNPRWPF